MTWRKCGLTCPRKKSATGPELAIDSKFFDAPDDFFIGRVTIGGRDAAAVASGRDCCSAVGRRAGGRQIVGERMQEVSDGDAGSPAAAINLSAPRACEAIFRLRTALEGCRRESHHASSGVPA